MGQSIFLSLILVIGSLGLIGVYRILPPLWLLAVMVFILLISPWRARRLAVEWGDFVKGAFDVYRFNLLDALSIKRPETRKEELETWKNYSQAIVFRLPEHIPELKKPDSLKLKANRVQRKNKRTHL